MNKDTMPYIEVVKSHIKALQFAIDQLNGTMPINEDGIRNLQPLEFMYFEVLTNRFSKLQDYLGSKVFDLCLAAKKENIDGLSMIDKLNKLEKIGIIDSADFWDELRELRNHLKYEYPSKPDLTAKYLNETYVVAPQLIVLAERMIGKL